MKNKTDLDYEYYIDYNPNMVDELSENQTLFLKKQNWNSAVPDENVIYVDGVSDVLDHI